MKKDSTTIDIDGLGSTIVKLRRAAGISQGRFAVETGTSKSQLSRIEDDKAPVSFEMLGRIAETVHDTPEAIVLYCLQQKYPRLMDTDIGKAFKKIAADVRAD